MPELNFKLSDSQKFQGLWSLLNPNYSEENGWVIEYGICDVYDDYAVVRNYAEECFERAYYSKNDETDSLEITNKVRCFILDVTESEKIALDALQKLNGSTFEKVDDIFTQKENLDAEKIANEQKIEELNISISTLTTERDEANAQVEALNASNEATVAEYTAAKESIAALEAKLEELNTFKKDIEHKEKEAIINTYTELLPEETLNDFTAKIDEFTALDLEKELAYTLMKSNPSVFSKSTQTNYVPKDDAVKSGLEEVLSKYKKN